ncbi:MAG: hypothetical protein ACC645_04960 [Pirellulales bacterium]
MTTAIHKYTSTIRLATLTAGMSIVATSSLNAQSPSGNASPKETSRPKAGISIIDNQIRFSWDGDLFGIMSNILLEENLLPGNAREAVADEVLGKWEPHWPVKESKATESGFIVHSTQPGSLKLRIEQKGNAFLFDYELSTKIFYKNPIYAAFPFPVEDFEFVSYPYLDSLTPPFKGTWRVYPQTYFLPFIFGKTKVNGSELFVGIGYTLDQDNLEQGALSVSSLEENSLGIYFPWRTFRSAAPGRITDSNRLYESYSLRVIYSLGESQAECIRNYRELCGYGFEVELMTDKAVEPKIKKAMMGYKDSPILVETPYGKAFHQQVDLETGEPFLSGYGRYIPVGANMHLAEQFYKFSLLYPNETWAKGYALDLSRFFINCWRESGGRAPLLYYPEKKQFWTYNEKYNQKKYYYGSWPQAVAAVSLYTIGEWEDNDEFKSIALAAAEDLANKGIKNRGISREYNAEGEGSAQVTSGLALQCLQFFRGKTKKPVFEKALGILRESVYEDFIRTNDYFGTSADDGAIGYPHPKNHDCFDMPNVANFYLQEHAVTGEKKYLAIAEDLMAYYWLSTVPRQFAGFKHQTQGLSLEQNSYPMLDVPFRSCTNLMVLPRLSEATGDSFYDDFFRLLLSTQFSYQAPDDAPFPAFYIGLVPNRRYGDHVDVLGEEKLAYIVEFLPFIFDTLSDESMAKRIFGKEVPVAADK